MAYRLLCAIRLSGAHVPARACWRGAAPSLLQLTRTGLVCGQAGAICMAPLGPLVPFLLGSWVGYTFGLAAYWKASLKWCDRVARRYPTLLVQALRTQPYSLEVPPSTVGDDTGKGLHDWIHHGSYGRLSLSID